MRTVLIPLSLCLPLVLAACAPTVPDSGVGFDTYRAGSIRPATQGGPVMRSQPLAVTPPVAVAAATPPLTEAQAVARDTAAALGRSVPAAASPVVVAGAAVPPPEVAADDTASLSSEQDFAAVAAERDIAADAARIASARQQYQVVEPVDLERVGDTGPNIIQYALTTRHRVGEKMHRRSNPFASARVDAKCAGFRTDDVAQEQFLAAGGPDRDKLGLDPDGDGFACGWNPVTYRNLVRN
jgi:hypothetical protein